MELVCRIERQYGIFTRIDACSYVLNIFDDGNVLSIVTDCSPHGTHVAGITAAHHPEVCVILHSWAFVLNKPHYHMCYMYALRTRNPERNF
jgi:hypothetical protein